MSYCRWSSMDYTCDIYAYDDVSGGITTHIASCRVDWGPEGPPPSPLSPEGAELLRAGKTEAWAVMNKTYMAELGKRPRVDIGLPLDGAHFNDPDARAFLERLLQLRALGYRFPDHVLDDVRQDAASA